MKTWNLSGLVIIAMVVGCGAAPRKGGAPGSSIQGKVVALADATISPTALLKPPGLRPDAGPKGPVMGPATIPARAAAHLDPGATPGTSPSGLALDALGLSPVRALTAYSISSSEVELTWSDDGSALNYEVAIAYGTAAPVSCAAGSQQFTTSGTSLYIYDLAQNSVYSFAVCARDGSGNTSVSSFVSVATYEDLQEPANVHATDVGVSTFTVAWQSEGVATDHFMIQAIAGHVVNPSCDGGYTVYGTVFQFYDTTPNTTYTVVLCSLDARGLESAGVALSLTTKTEALAPDPTGFMSTAAGLDAINLAWQSGGGTTDHFLLKTRIGAIAPAACDGGDVLTNTADALTGLADGTTYSFRLCAVNRSGVASAGVTATAPTVSAASIVDGAILGLLGRQASLGEESAFANVVRNHHFDLPGLEQYFLTQRPMAIAVVDAGILAVFGRPASPGEESSFANVVQANGYDLQGFETYLRPPQAAVVDAAILAIFGRAASQAEESTFGAVAQAQGYDVRGLELYFLGFRNAAVAVVDASIQQLLDRQASAGEENSFANLVQSSGYDIHGLNAYLLTNRPIAVGVVDAAIQQAFGRAASAQEEASFANVVQARSYTIADLVAYFHQ